MYLKRGKYVEFKNGTVNYTAWLPDRNILFIGENLEVIMVAF